ncbi:MAG: DUF456 domain-containing protein [Treponema sp.]|nr:DUF456 domain-containing protein [Treponema sp.]
MEIVLVVIAFLFLLTGFLGSVIPVLPGPPLSFIGLLLIQWSGYGEYSIVFLLIWGAVTIAMMVIDNLLPAWMTKKFGGSRKAVIGSVLGLIVGVIFFAPLGILLGPFLGALAGEVLNNRLLARKERIKAAANEQTEKNEEPQTPAAEKTNPLKVAFGAFLAFILGTGAKLIIGSMMIYYAITAVFK